MVKEIGRETYDEAIQGLRGIAIILIVLSHLFGKLSTLGGVGVALFVSMSGYIACRKVRYNDKQLDYKTIKYRILKLYPLYFIVTCITATYFNPEIVYGTSRNESILAFILNILMIQTYWPRSSFFGAFSQVGWYIPVVVLCTVCSNPIYKLWRKLNVEGALLVGLFFVFFEYIAMFLGTGWKYVHWLTYSFPLFRLMEFVVGGAIFVLCEDIEKADIDKKKKYRLLVGLLLVGLVITSFILWKTLDNKMYLRIIWWYIPTWCILGLYSKFDYINRFLKIRLLKFIGDISFEIFLLHLMMYKLAQVVLVDEAISTSIVKITSLLLTVAVSYFVYRLDTMWKHKLRELLWNRLA